MSDTIIQAAALILPLIFAIVFHEVAHGLMARTLGDPTAEEQGRLSLNPIKHVDPVGTVFLPGLLALFHLPVFGWAKPVPVVASRLRHPRRDMMLVGAAGPGSNLIMAAIAAVALGLAVGRAGELQDPTTLLGFFQLNLFNFISINVFLALFNLLPIPPFDGSHIVEGLLPERMAQGYAKFRTVGMLIPIFLIIVLPYLIPGFSVTKYLIAPVEWAIGWYARLAALVAGV
ncbi:MAG: site-2 protease family protein [Pseudomonadota bacterium]|nr:site-2 protease family protein [Pseudomonadota bacterium]